MSRDASLLQRSPNQSEIISLLKSTLGVMLIALNLQNNGCSVIEKERCTCRSTFTRFGMVRRGSHCNEEYSLCVATTIRTDGLREGKNAGIAYTAQ